MEKFFEIFKKFIFHLKNYYIIFLDVIPIARDYSRKFNKL